MSFGTLFPDLKCVHLNDLNCFERLVHLELKGIGLEGEKLNLKNLQIALLENLNEDINFELALG